MRLPALLLTLLLPAVATAASPRASSELKDDDGRHGASLAFDGLMATGWAEGDLGNGDGAWIELPFDRPIDVESISIWPGNLARGERSLREYGRPHTITVELLGAEKPSDMLEDEEDPTRKQLRLQDVAKEGPTRIDVPVRGKARGVRVTVDQAYEGGVFTDTFIAEIAVNFDRGHAPGVVEGMKTWQESTSAQRQAEKAREEVIALFDTISAAEFGDSDSLQKIMNRAADGAPYVRSRVLSAVPAGFRVHALPPEETAVEAILKLKDANGIPALEMAALRLKGPEARALQEKVEVFYAYQDLIGGGNVNIPYWGQEGWEVGAIRSFEEPIGIEVDQFGDIYVADLGNHRIQRFTPKGKSDRQWGGEAGITNRWFEGTRRYYVAGAAPDEKPGSFVNPVDVDVLPGKEADGFVVLDAAGRVQVFDGEGRLVIGWEVRSDTGIRPNVGGEGYIEVSKGKVVVVWGNEVFVYGTDAEEIARWEIEDGTPNGAETLKNGKLALIFGRDLVMYSLDGFRHGSLMNAGDFGVGFEDWDVTIDQKGKLWGVTDTGWLYKFKRPGKLDYKVKVSDYSLIRPRLAVFDDIAYILERDRILKIDALELNAEAKLEAERAAEAAGAAEEGATPAERSGTELEETELQ